MNPQNFEFFVGRASQANGSKSVLEQLKSWKTQNPTFRVVAMTMTCNSQLADGVYLMICYEEVTTTVQPTEDTKAKKPHVISPPLPECKAPNVNRRQLLMDTERVAHDVLKWTTQDSQLPQAMTYFNIAEHPNRHPTMRELVKMHKNQVPDLVRCDRKRSADWLAAVEDALHHLGLRFSMTEEDIQSVIDGNA